MKTLNGSYPQQFSINLQLILLPKHITDPFASCFIERFRNISYVDAKIQRLLIPSLLSEQFKSFMRVLPFS